MKILTFQFRLPDTKQIIYFPTHKIAFMLALEERKKHGDTILSLRCIGKAWPAKYTKLSTRWKQEDEDIILSLSTALHI